LPSCHQITVGGELNKLVSNVGFGRVDAGIHWRQDIHQGMLLGEAVAIGLLRDQEHLRNENYTASPSPAQRQHDHGVMTYICMVSENSKAAIEWKFLARVFGSHGVPYCSD